jgi:hypothetical protein
LASRAAEETLFQRDVEQLAKLENFEPLAQCMEDREPLYASHARGFWGSRAERKVPWMSLVSLARAAVLLAQHAQVEKQWSAPADALGWFTSVGWEIDRQGEILFRDDANLPGALHAIRARLRRAYLRHLDKVNGAFSELVHHHGVSALGLSFAGEVLAKLRPPKDPMAVLVLDACRYDLGTRIAETLNRGEPAQRAEVFPARAPLPSITALGMPFALADDATALMVGLTNETPARWRVTGDGASHDLTIAEARREWLLRRFKLKPIATTDLKSLLEMAPPVPKDAGRLLFAFGDEFDSQGHEGELRFTGAEEFIERYARVISRLRDAGYTTVAVVTDHGFIHWEPEKDEVDALPTGELLWRSRRAVVGHGLKHPTAVSVPVTGSDLECCVPRSVNAFRTYGGMGFFHGGATLQELIIPVMIARWPKKAEKIGAILTPLGEITSINPRVEVKPIGTDQLPGIAADPRLMGRQVFVKIVDAKNGRRIFRSAQALKLQAEGPPLMITLAKDEGAKALRGTRVQVQLIDADNDEILDRCDAELKIDLEEWD